MVAPLVEYDSEQVVPIKAILPEERELANRRIVARVDRLEARRRQQIKQEEQIKTEPRTIDPHGVVMCGQISEEERRALVSNNPAKIREIARLRQRALYKSRMQKLGDKVSTMEALARLQRGG